MRGPSIACRLEPLEPEGLAEARREVAAVARRAGPVRLHRRDRSADARLAGADARRQPAGGDQPDAAGQGDGRARRPRFLLPDDVKRAAPAVLRHRLVLKPEADLEGLTAGPGRSPTCSPPSRCRSDCDTTCVRRPVDGGRPRGRRRWAFGPSAARLRSCSRRARAGHCPAGSIAARSSGDGGVERRRARCCGAVDAAAASVARRAAVPPALVELRSRSAAARSSIWICRTTRAVDRAARRLRRIRALRRDLAGSRHRASRHTTRHECALRRRSRASAATSASAASRCRGSSPWAARRTLGGGAARQTVRVYPDLREGRGSRCT